MNIELLSKMVKELLLDNNVVNLPALGSFVAEIVPASFSDSGHTINPPYRKLYFRDNIEREDDLLVKLYAAENNVTEEVAADVINGFIAEIKGLLNSRKSVVLPELGRLRATKENNYFFVPFENINIYPEGEGLDPVPLKIRTVQTETPEESVVAETPVETHEEPVAPEPAPVEETTPEATETPEPTTDAEPVILNGVEVIRIGGSSETPADGDNAPETPIATVAVDATQPEKKGFSKGWLRAVIVICSILLAFALFILLFILLSYLFPAFFDRLLWS